MFHSSINDERSALNKYFAKLHADVSYTNVNTASSLLDKPLTVDNQQTILRSLSKVALVNDNEFFEILNMLESEEKNQHKREVIGLVLLQLRYDDHGSILNIEENFISLSEFNGPGLIFSFELMTESIKTVPPPKRPLSFFVKHGLIKNL